ncbi:hypothetical protein [Acidithrix sp. C25]|uniref:hypothetical protein n=1 Tax=Acidithrix sp. C25 TaxID=1671482 RepID=UPI00191BC76C|nr:hypothetical protein [Acidithrix sp. C25]
MVSDDRPDFSHNRPQKGNSWPMGFRASKSLRIAGFVAPMILGASIIAAYMHFGILGSGPGALPSAVLIAPSTMTITTTSSTSLVTTSPSVTSGTVLVGSSSTTTPTTTTSLMANSQNLEVVTPTVKVYSYDSADSKPSSVEDSKPVAPVVSTPAPQTTLATATAPSTSIATITTQASSDSADSNKSTTTTSATGDSKSSSGGDLSSSSSSISSSPSTSTKKSDS